MKQKKYIGLTYGDPASIGPEILLKTLKRWNTSRWKQKFKPLVIGRQDSLIKKYKPGKPSISSGTHAYKCLKEAVDLAKEKKVTAIVTGPVSKEYINLANIKFVGQTEEIAKLCNINPDNVIMLFVANDLKIALFTRHIPLKLVSKKLNRKNLENFISLLNAELKKWFQIKSPKIAVLGLNPHAGENGLFGNEEKKIILPIIKSLNLKGLKISGPLSADATLAKAGQNYLSGKKQNYDAYISFYHDQALPMFKAVCGMDGVNVTLGLPFLRASVDHGTAFDIAGKNKADNNGLISAVMLVEKLLCKDEDC